MKLFQADMKNHKACFKAEIGRNWNKGGKFREDLTFSTLSMWSELILNKYVAESITTD